MKKSSTAAAANLNESLIELNIPELKSDEAKEVALLLKACLTKDCNIHTLVRAYLANLAANYNKTW